MREKEYYSEGRIEIEEGSVSDEDTKKLSRENPDLHLILNGSKKFQDIDYEVWFDPKEEKYFQVVIRTDCHRKSGVRPTKIRTAGDEIQFDVYSETFPNDAEEDAEGWEYWINKNPAEFGNVHTKSMNHATIKVHHDRLGVHKVGYELVEA